MSSEPAAQRNTVATGAPLAGAQALAQEGQRLARESQQALAGDARRRDAMRHHVAALAALERHLEATLGRQVEQVTAPAEAAAAVRRFATLARHQREALDTHLASLERLGDSGTGAAVAAPAAVARPGDGPGERAGATGDAESGAGDAVAAAGPHAVAAAVRDAYAAVNRLAISYTMLHHTARVFYDIATAELAERHLRGYAAAAQELNRLMPEVVAWAFREEGQRCLCRCPGCALGVCLCVASTVTATDQAWRETAAAPDERGVVVVRTASCPATLGLEDGDRLLAVDGQDLSTWPDALVAILQHASGEPVRLQVERGGTRVALTAMRP
jgi:hypothetical protein